MPERERDWDMILELRAEAERDAMIYQCPETSDGQHCGHWHDGERCCACGQAGPDWTEGEVPF
jgi:hypothetical protein